MQQLILEIVGGWVRAGLAALTAYLVTHNVLTPEQGDRLSADLLVRFLEWAPLGIAMLWTAIAKYRARVKFLTALEAPAGTSETQVAQRIENGLGSSLKAGAVLLVLGLAGGALACGGSVRHIAVVADQTLAQTVFAVDDAQWAACHTAHVLPADKCAQLDPLVKQALLDVKALTAALQAAPKNVAVPKSLPALLADLSAIRKVVDALGAGPTFVTLSTRLTTATDRVVGLLKQFAGGQ